MPSNKRLRPCYVDRLTSLPDELLGRILSLIPTKDVVAMEVLSKRMRRVFPWITSIDLDESPVNDCMLSRPIVWRYPFFESFVVKVLQRLWRSEDKHPLTRFRLRFGGDSDGKLKHVTCENSCFPYLKPDRLKEWISYPLIHCGLKELDLAFSVRNPRECKLPPQIFDCQTLEVLKLDSNLELDDGAEIPMIYLPNLKLLYLHSFIFSEDDFLSRLISSCPSLDDLCIAGCRWKTLKRLSISSHSLRRLTVYVFHTNFDEHSCDLVLINTPNLQYLNYCNNVPVRFSVSPMNALVEARIFHYHPLQINGYTRDDSARIEFDLVKELSNVQSLSLLEYALEGIYLAHELKETDLPVFRNLRTLKLDPVIPIQDDELRWDIMLLLLLYRSPLLETLVLLKGLFDGFHCAACAHVYPSPSVLAEAETWRTTRTIPSCCLTHLTRIEINNCLGVDRELNMIKFLLSKTSALKEFVISLKCYSEEDVQYGAGGCHEHQLGCQEHQHLFPNQEHFESRLKELPRASDLCSIIVKRESTL